MAGISRNTYGSLSIEPTTAGQLGALERIMVSGTAPAVSNGMVSPWMWNAREGNFLTYLQKVIEQRKASNDPKSYVSSLFKKGINKIAQKVGEEAVELVIEAKDENDELFKNEAADLLFHYLILLRAKGFWLADIEDVLKGRHKK